MSWTEWIAAASYLWSVWLLAENKPLGWWIGLIGTVLYIWIFYVVWLPGEILIQAYFLATSLWGIWMWLHGGKNREPEPVTRASGRLLAGTAVVFALGWAGLFWAFTAMEGKVPLWDSFTTIVSFIAQYYLVKRCVESWHLWILVDIVYVPLYASRGLTVTAGLYAIFLWLAYRGLKNFQKEYRSAAASKAL
ncbi:MAG: nicotinamide mononucleotide transporter [Elusimicrobia bacterium CG_4_9_14_3_um_filter_62_55]|nr:MAG: nicotinamide mononucleotide transporter [Elusimicrobia bacterium CG22_combo_CG10-13_8_21_14_all_63_91]PJA18058.1 MAG: nicotinamide mononucleotide transporter [Elusimicrobia bacterium CG_4_10_14_0_2_um_filter_63_34]PJB23914.1 MAG: nicotinamide mononucleotide transporter [Elusimicrobia bacterium CG_4_9_14_3_um_filter_62_55]